jgi:hypothetical protein
MKTPDLIRTNVCSNKKTFLIINSDYYKRLILTFVLINDKLHPEIKLSLYEKNHTVSNCFSC